MTCILISRSIGGVAVDVVISEDHEAEVEIPEHPVEKGAKLSDHAWRKGYKVTLESVIDGPRAVASYQQLLAVQEALEPFSLVTGLKVYSNMMLVRLNPTRDKEHARILKFEAELREVRIADTEAAGPTSGDDKAQSTVKRGQIAARETTPPPKTMSTIEAAVAK